MKGSSALLGLRCLRRCAGSGLLGRTTAAGLRALNTGRFEGVGRDTDKAVRLRAEPVGLVKLLHDFDERFAGDARLANLDELLERAEGLAEFHQFFDANENVERLELLVPTGGAGFEFLEKALAALFGTPVELDRGGAATAEDVIEQTAGATLGNLSPALADEIDLPDDSEGVAVIDVAAGTPAARLGMRTGDIIQMLNGADIRAMAELKAALGASKNIRRWQVQLRRGAQVMNLMITL